MEKSRIDLPIGVTLDRFIKNSQHHHPEAAGELSQLLRDIAFIIEQAGGKATDGKTRILDLVPESIHHTTPLFIGSGSMVDDLMKKII